MIQAAHNRAAMALMLLAALACWANAPRLAATLLVGDAANLAAAQDARTRQAISARLAALPQGCAQAVQLAHELDDGEQSRAVADSLPALAGLVVPQSLRVRQDAAPVAPPLVPQVSDTGFCLLPAAVLVTDLPPPPDDGRAASPRSGGCPAPAASLVRGPPKSGC